LIFIGGVLAGFVGLNNIKANDYVNVVVQALTHIRPLRNYFLLNDPENHSELGTFTLFLYFFFFSPHFLLPFVGELRLFVYKKIKKNKK